MDMLQILFIVIGALVGLALGFGLGVGYRKKVAEREIGSAEMEATRLINEAIRSGENRKKEMLLEAKDEIHKSRTEHDKEVKERRAELSKQERRLEQKEATLDKKTEAFERKEEDLAKKLQKVTETQAQADAIKEQQMQALEKISGLTQEQAKQYLLNSVEEEVRHETAMKIKEIEQQMKDEAEDKAREVISTAIQRCAADHAKRWWPQSEMLIAAAMAYRDTRKEEYLVWFEKCLHYIQQHFSRPDGEWNGILRRDNHYTEPMYKGSTVKGPFHVPRCLIMVDEMLTDILGDQVQWENA